MTIRAAYLLIFLLDIKIGHVALVERLLARLEVAAVAVADRRGQVVEVLRRGNFVVTRFIFDWSVSGDLQIGRIARRVVLRVAVEGEREI